MIKKKIFYWSPCLNPVGTVISTLNSAIALSKYGRDYDVSIINACGEWDNYKDEIKKNSINLINFKFKYFKCLPKTGFIGSRISYIIIFILSFFPLIFLLKNRKPDFIILHLITSLPLFILNFFKLKTKFILRISGYPRLNLLRKFFWKKVSKKLELTTCPTLGLRSKLLNNNIFETDKIVYLPDAILNYDKFKIIKKKFSIVKGFSDKKVILSVGRLTKQKNFSYLINEFYKFENVNKDYILCIIGEGEERENLEKIIQKLNLTNKVFLIGYRNDIYDCMQNSEIFVLSSLWEEVGFVIVEAAINNLYIISSNCPNGPNEFLNEGKNGLLFNSNTKDELLKCFLEYTKFSEKKIFEDKVKLKNNALHYTKFRHYIKLKNILNKLSY